jgi:hypothetical protein
MIARLIIILTPYPILNSSPVYVGSFWIRPIGIEIVTNGSEIGVIIRRFQATISVPSGPGFKTKFQPANILRAHLIGQKSKSLAIDTELAIYSIIFAREELSNFL